MADFAHLDDTSEPVSGSPAKHSAMEAVSMGRVLVDRLTPDTGILLFFGLFLFVIALGVNLFLEESLARLGWSLLLSNSDIHAPTGLALTLLIGTLATNRLRRPRRCRKPPAGDEMNRAIEILATQPNASAGLVRIGDKKILFSDCGKAFIMYAQQGRSWIALFDPVGDRKAWSGLTLNFMEQARKAGCRAVFYQVSGFPAAHRRSRTETLQARRAGGRRSDQVRSQGRRLAEAAPVHQPRGTRRPAILHAETGGRAGGSR